MWCSSQVCFFQHAVLVYRDILRSFDLLDLRLPCFFCHSLFSTLCACTCRLRTLTWPSTLCILQGTSSSPCLRRSSLHRATREYRNAATSCCTHPSPWRCNLTSFNPTLLSTRQNGSCTTIHNWQLFTRPPVSTLKGARQLVKGSLAPGSNVEQAPNPTSQRIPVDSVPSTSPTMSHPGPHSKNVLHL